jgi:acetyl esterase
MPEPITRSERLHPEVRALLDMMDAQGAPPIESQEPVAVRLSRAEPMKLLAGEPEPLGRVEDLLIPGPGGSLPIRVYATVSGASENDARRPGFIYFHGGGFVLGSLDSHDALCRALAKESGSVVVAVDYRLAPENKFPAAVEDTYAATQWVAANAARLGIDTQRLVVGGDSAGANLATISAIRCRNAGGPHLAAQVLIYPATNASSFDTASHRDFARGYFLTRGGLDWFIGHYLPSSDLVHNPDVSPLLAQDLSGLPRALVITAEFDPLRDEGEAYAQRLRHAGVTVTVTRYPGMIHAFLSMAGVIADARKAIRQVADFTRAIPES